MWKWTLGAEHWQIAPWALMEQIELYLFPPSLFSHLAKRSSRINSRAAQSTRASLSRNDHVSRRNWFLKNRCTLTFLSSASGSCDSKRSRKHCLKACGIPQMCYGPDMRATPNPYWGEELILSDTAGKASVQGWSTPEIRAKSHTKTAESKLIGGTPITHKSKPRGQVWLRLHGRKS